MSADTAQEPWNDERIREFVKQLLWPIGLWPTVGSTEIESKMQAAAHYQQRITQLEAALAAAQQEAASLRERGGWEPVENGEITGMDGWDMEFDEIALTIGYGESASSSFSWPEDGYEYGVFRRKLEQDGEVGDE